ncbi:MAG: hypothetical protein QXG86_02570 [Candidatus Woesearchaeota archaeon]
MKSNKRKILMIVLILLIILIVASYFIFFRRNAALDCNSYSLEDCPKGCVICPTCEVCSSIGCQTEKFCESMGFDEGWYDNYVAR